MGPRLAVVRCEWIHTAIVDARYSRFVSAKWIYALVPPPEI